MWHTRQLVPLLFVAVLLVGCDTGEPRYLSYDSSPSPGGDGFGGGEVKPIDSCRMSGKHAVVILARIETKQDWHGARDYCPDPPLYDMGHDSRQATVLDIALGNGPAEKETVEVHILGKSLLESAAIEAGDVVLMAARWWADTGAWIPFELLLVHTSSSLRESAEPGGEYGPRDVDLPAAWSDLEAELRQSDASQCDNRHRWAQRSDAEFQKWVVDAEARYCDGLQSPDDPDPGDGTDTPGVDD